MFRVRVSGTLSRNFEFCSDTCRREQDFSRCLQQIYFSDTWICIFCRGSLSFFHLNFGICPPHIPAVFSCPLPLYIFSFSSVTHFSPPPLFFLRYHGPKSLSLLYFPLAPTPPMYILTIYLSFTPLYLCDIPKTVPLGRRP